MDAETGQSMIRIQRKEQFWAKGGNFKVYIDEKMVGNLELNSAEFFVEPGQHKIAIKMGWSKSNEIMIQSDSGETSTLICGNNESVLYPLFIIVFIQFFSSSILRPFHLGIPMEKRIDFYYFIFSFLTVIILSLLPSALVFIKEQK